MNEESVQPDSAGQEADNSVANKLGILDQNSLKGLLGSFLDEEEQQAPAPMERQDESTDPVSSGEENDLSEEDSDQPEVDDSSLSKGVQKRINKLVAAKKAAQAELESQKAALLKLQKELEDAKSSAPVAEVAFDDYVQTLDTQQKVEEEYKRALNIILWCEDNANGGQIPSADGNGPELSDVEVRAMKKKAILRKELELPARLQFLQQQAAAEADVNSNFPWWNKPETEEYQVAQQVLKEFPELKKRRADWKHVAGLVVLGAKAYAEMQGKKKAAAPTQIKRAPVQPSARAVPTTSTTQNDIAKARQKFMKNSSDQQGLSDLVKAMGFV
jgi:hypothetical protein